MQVMEGSAMVGVGKNNLQFPEISTAKMKIQGSQIQIMIVRCQYIHARILLSMSSICKKPTRTMKLSPRRVSAFIDSKVVLNCGNSNLGEQNFDDELRAQSFNNTRDITADTGGQTRTIATTR